MMFVNGIPLPTRQTRKKIVYSTITFFFLIISYIVVAGSPTNSLHESALAWSFSGMLAVIGAYVFGAVFDNINVMKTFIEKSK